MTDPLSLKQVLETCGMVQISIKSRSLRIRKHRFHAKRYFATTRTFKTYGETSYDLATVEDAVTLLSEFCKGEI